MMRCWKGVDEDTETRAILIFFKFILEVMPHALKLSTFRSFPPHLKLQESSLVCSSGAPPSSSQQASSWFQGIDLEVWEGVESCRWEIGHGWRVTVSPRFLWLRVSMHGLGVAGNGP
ncbi:hypothetical protein F511_27857 [Dorcoceras hygrometricum]|uniref:Uncharacterized protein n=1 Tax=Dorcoceras hygrometricum TaxID=472368 RepID=A0A2Z7A9D1_9LAMI|nr:hypothetical protein F511_27857 [Dorcoceras hygrometricum]